MTTRGQPVKRTTYYKDGSVHYESYLIDGEIHRVDGPAYIHYYKDGPVRCEWYRKDGSVRYERYYMDSKEYAKEEYMFKVNLLNPYQVEDLAVLLLDPDEETRNIAKKLLRPNLKIAFKSMSLDDLTEAWEATPKSTNKEWEDSITELLEDLHERELA